MIRSVEVKVFTSDGTEYEPFRFQAEPGTAFSDIGVKMLISQLMGEINKTFPEAIYKVIRVGKNKYNVVPYPSANA